MTEQTETMTPAWVLEVLDDDEEEGFWECPKCGRNLADTLEAWDMIERIDTPVPSGWDRNTWIVRDNQDYGDSYNTNLRCGNCGVALERPDGVLLDWA